MASYGTIPTTSATAAANLEYISRAKHRFTDGLGHRRPWRLIADHRSITLPPNLHVALNRIKINLAYFRMNYAIVVLVILFLALLYHPISLIVFIFMISLWLFLYFLRDQPLFLAGRVVEDWAILLLLSVFTVGFLFLTNATVNIIIAILIGAAVVVAHAAVRNTENLYLDDEAAAGLIAPVSVYCSSCSRSIDFTVGFLSLTNATLNIVIAILIGAAMRNTENLYLDDEAAAGGLIAPGS